MHSPQNDAGNISAMIIGVGILGAAMSGAFVDKTKRFNETIKALFVVACIAAVAVGVMCG